MNDARRKPVPHQGLGRYPSDGRHDTAPRTRARRVVEERNTILHRRRAREREYIDFGRGQLAPQRIGVEFGCDVALRSPCVDHATACAQPLGQNLTRFLRARQ